mmetsp:Transcript_23776/g.65955  ORF Transcript_23776/g.65955 Transcript_23776/m.65955 type:complete len:327 (-) Transcript_23776:816-1796(-)
MVVRHHRPPLLVEDELVEHEVSVQQVVDVGGHGHLNDTGLLITQHVPRADGPGDEVSPCCDTESHPLHVASHLKAIQDRWNSLHAQLVAGVHRNALESVSNDLVAEALDQSVLILVQVDGLNAGNLHQCWPKLLVHHRVVVFLHKGVCGGLVDVLQAHQQGREHHRGVNHIEKADLSQLIGSDILHKLHADVLPLGPSRAAVHKLVLDHPLAECLAVDRPVVLQVVLVCQVDNQLVVGNWRDAVNHAVGEGAVEFDPLLEICAVLLGSVDHTLPHVLTIARDVVTRQDGGASCHAGLAGCQASHDVAQGRGSQVGLGIGICFSPGL